MIPMRRQLTYEPPRMFVYPPPSSFCNITDKLKELRRKPPRLLISPNRNLRGLLMTKQSFPRSGFLRRAVTLSYASSSPLPRGRRSGISGPFKQTEESLRHFRSDSASRHKWLATSKCDCLLPSFRSAAGLCTFFSRSEFSYFQSQKGGNCLKDKAARRKTSAPSFAARNTSAWRVGLCLAAPSLRSKFKPRCKWEMRRVRNAQHCSICTNEVFHNDRRTPDLKEDISHTENLS